jgi:hypothetical protein
VIGSIGVLLITMNDNASTNSSTRTPFDPIRWELANLWLSEGQADDRTPMNGSVGDCHGPPTVRRAFARRSHQLMFKKWSQARHD